jgi:serine/threonine protein kinase
LNAEQAGNARNTGKVLHVQLFEISAPTDPEMLDKIVSTRNGNAKARSQAFVTCDQSQVSLNIVSRRWGNQAAPSRCFISDWRHSFELLREVDRIYVHVELDMNDGHSCRTSAIIPLGDVPTTTNLEPQFKGTRLDARWVDMQAGFKLSIGLVYTERTGLHLNFLENFELAGGSRTVLKMIKKDTRRVYVVRKLVGSLRRHPPCPATAEDDLRIAAFLCQVQRNEQVMMISPWAEGGHLFYYLQRERTFGLERSRIYVAELILILESMGSHGFIPQDLRPLAIKLNRRGHIMYCDFELYQSGSAMKPDIPISWQENRYLAPEAFTQLESSNSTGKILSPAWTSNLRHH